ncbi:MAG: prepilin-type N-terminal cleavage/methylation domain-containing protein [Sulfuritalea sp.]|nr:prepilin-type N-terminal cleavage/methylation domain-containing protein [Sulfuritalea sp.]
MRIPAVPPAPTVAQHGFTLVELAIVMFIVALLLGGMLLPLSAQQDIRARLETEKNLGDIRDALLGYGIINGYLPCPAPVDLSTNGVESSRDGNGACPIRVGLLPWTTLGLGRNDSWNHYFRYSVTPAFSNSGTGTGAKFSTSSAGDITIRTRDSSGNLQTLAANVPAAVVSHGAFGAWAYSAAGSQIADSANLNTDEDTNGNDAAGTSFVSRTPSPQGAAAPGEFDDLVVWLPTNTLVNRLTAAGKL